MASKNPYERIQIGKSTFYRFDYPYGKNSQAGNHQSNDYPHSYHLPTSAFFDPGTCLISYSHAITSPLRISAFWNYFQCTHLVFFFVKKNK